MTPIQKLLKDPSIQEPLETLQGAVDSYELFRAENFSLLNPTEAIADLKRRIASASPAEAKRLADELKAMDHPALKEVQISHQREGFKRWHTVREAAVNFLETAADCLEKIKADAVEAEAEFFKTHSLQRESTSVSRRAVEALNRCAELRDAYKNPPPSVATAIPSARNMAVFGWLGITD